MPIFLALGRQRLEDHEFETCLNYTESSCLKERKKEKRQADKGVIQYFEITFNELDPLPVFLRLSSTQYFSREFDVLIHTCNLIPREAEAEGLPLVGGQPGLLRTRSCLRKHHFLPNRGNYRFPLIAEVKPPTMGFFPLGTKGFGEFFKDVLTLVYNQPQLALGLMGLGRKP